MLELNSCACLLPTIQVITNLVKMVKARDIRRPFCPAGHWLSEEVNIRADKVLGPRMELWKKQLLVYINENKKK